jgi:Fic family protein
MLVSLETRIGRKSRVRASYGTPANPGGGSWPGAIAPGQHRARLLAHDLSKSPGRYRTGPIYIHDEKRDLVVYEGPDAGRVPALMEEFAVSLQADLDVDPLVRGAMAHLNLVMIHPFRGGNGRMARALQTLTISRQTIVEPAFSGIEEWLGHNTDDYYQVLATTGQGSWRPRADAHLWAAFNIRAHHMQAQTVAQRVSEASEIWGELDTLVSANHLADRVTGILYKAVLGYRVRRFGMERKMITF